MKKNMSFVENAPLQKNLVMERRTPLSSAQKLIWLALVLSVSLCHQAQATTLNSAASSLAVNAWVQINPTVSGMKDVFGVSEPGYISEYANSGTWDPVNKKFRFCGSHHGNTYESKCVEYTDSDNTFREIAWAPGACKQLAGCGSTPFNHAYDHNAVNPANGDFYFMHYMQRTIRRYAGGIWSTLLPDVPTSSSSCCRVVKWFPALNALIVVDADWGVWKGVPGSGTSITWTRLADTSVNETGLVNLTGLSATTVTGEYSATKQVMVFGSGTTMYKLDAAGNFTKMVGSPVNLGINTSSLSVDPVSGNFLVMTNGSSTMREFNPDGTGSWSTISTTIPSAISALNGPGDGNVSASVTTYGVIMYVKYTSSGTVVYLYKHAAGSGSTPPPSDTIAPTTPTGLSVVAASSSQINVSWTASTDNVGVAGYRIFRQGQQIAMATGTSYQNTGLSPSTTYSYTVAAYDLAGNLSSQSASTSATTLNTTAASPASSGNVITLVDFGSSSSSNIFGLAGWSTVIKDVYTDYQNIGPGGMTIVVGSNYTYNYQGVTGTPQIFNAGDKIRVTWYNNSSAAVSFTPNITFTSPDRIIAGTGSWYPMTLVTVPSFGSATSDYSFTATTAGSYSLVNVNVNYTNNKVIVADKIDLIPFGSSTPSSFDYSLSNGGSRSVLQGQSASNSITVTLASGAAQAVTFSASGLPAGVTALFSPTSCGPSCSSTLSLSTTGSTPTGNYTVTVAATGGGVTRSTNFPLTVTAPTTPPAIGSSDFQTRCAAAGVLRCFSFDTDADFNFGSGGTNGAWGYNYGYMPPSGQNDYSRILRDTSTKASGVSSLRFTVPSNTGADTSGSWFANVSPISGSNNIGNGGTLFVQWRQRFSADWINTNYSGGTTQPKLMSVSAGDKATCVPGKQNTVDCPGSCTDIDTVAAAWEIGKNNVILSYHSCTGDGTHNAYAPMEYLDPKLGQIVIQNAIPGCYYGPVPGAGYPVPPCKALIADNWMTFKVEITVGNFNQNNSTYRMWVGYDGQPLVKILDFSPASGRPFYYVQQDPTHLFGKVWFLPYMTNKDSTQTHPVGYVWYDDIIFSTQDIADPGLGGGPQPPQPPSNLTIF